MPILQMMTAQPSSTFPTGHAKRVYVSGEYAYLAVGSSGLAVIDVSNPTNPGASEGEIPFGNYFLIFIGLSVICLIFTKKRQTDLKAR